MKDVFGLSDEFEGQGQSSRSPGTKNGIFSDLSAACVRFVFGKTYLASSYRRPMK